MTPDREIRMRCIEAAARLWAETACHQDDRPNRVMDSATQFERFVIGGASQASPHQPSHWAKKSSGFEG